MEIPHSQSSKIQSCSINTDGGVTLCVELADSSDAKLFITPLNGREQMEVKLNQKINSISIDKGEITEGINVITLYVDGNKVDSKTIKI